MLRDKCTWILLGGFLPGDLALECEDSGGEESWQLPTGKLFPQTLGG